MGEQQKQGHCHILAPQTPGISVGSTSAQVWIENVQKQKTIYDNSLWAQSNYTLTSVLAQKADINSPTATITSDATNATVKTGLTGRQGGELVKSGILPLDGVMHQ